MSDRTSATAEPKPKRGRYFSATLRWGIELNAAVAAASALAQPAAVEPTTTRQPARQNEKRQRDWPKQQNEEEAKLLYPAQSAEREVEKLPRAKAAKVKTSPAAESMNATSQEVLQSATKLIQDAEDLETDECRLTVVSILQDAKVPQAQATHALMRFAATKHSDAES